MSRRIPPNGKDKQPHRPTDDDEVQAPTWAVSIDTASCRPPALEKPPGERDRSPGASPTRVGGQEAPTRVTSTGTLDGGNGLTPRSAPVSPMSPPLSPMLESLRSPWPAFLTDLRSGSSLHPAGTRPDLSPDGTLNFVLGEDGRMLPALKNRNTPEVGGMSGSVTPQRETSARPSTVERLILGDETRRHVDEVTKCHSFALHPTAANVEASLRAALLLLDAVHDRSVDHCFDRIGLIAYFWYYDRVWRLLVQAITVVIVLVLPFYEAPCSDQPTIPNNLRTCPSEGAAAIVEGCFLLPIITLDAFLRIRAEGKKRPLSSHWNLAFLFALFTNVLDLILSSALPTSQWLRPRLLRIVRPVYLAQCSDFSRIAVVQALKTMRDTMPVAMSLLLFLAIWAGMGFIIFNTGTYFVSYYDSFMNIVTLMTTANFPDIMLPAYRVSPLFSIYFIVFLLCSLYFGLAMVLATVSATYRDLLKERALHSYVIKREAFKECFRSIDADGSGLVEQAEFSKVYLELDRLMTRAGWWRLRRYDETLAMNTARIIFCQVDADGSGTLELDEFYKVGDLVVQHHSHHDDWSQTEEGGFFCRSCRRICHHPAFSWLIVALTILDIGLVAAFGDGVFTNLQPFTGQLETLWDIDWALFALWFALLGVRVAAMSPWTRYFRDPTHVFDLVFLLAAGAGKLGTELVLRMCSHDGPLMLEVEAAGRMTTFRTLLVLRASQALRIFWGVPQARAILHACFVIVPDIGHLVVMLILVYQVFGTIGMSAFNGVLSADNPRLAGSDYDKGGYYDFAHFNSWRQGTQSLFYLMVVNNWYIMARGTALAVDNEIAVAFFVLFYVICVVVVLNLIMAMFIELHRFRLQMAQEATPARRTSNLISQLFAGENEASTQS